MLVPLGWTWGVVCMVVVGFYSLYVNWLLAAFHFINGQRFIRYRDLMGYLYGRKMCYFTWVLQFVTLLLGNMGFILLGGRVLRALKWWRMFKGYVSLQTGNQLRIQSLSIEAPMVHRYHRSDVLHIFFFYSNNFCNERLAGSLYHRHLRLHCHTLGGGGG
ncbi:hypothetical protein L3X38_029082 [Prunus dulcis]|uniref:Amino acid transporter transmembrane domain-containing protein n=1 Tax=Prunus dulcis TaxID=3755 RepID=A0AAD4VQX1_PRUDU|nr:hypothetical protein L3X38_029082 [Prunus dulcis]